MRRGDHRSAQTDDAQRVGPPERRDHPRTPVRRSAHASAAAAEHHRAGVEVGSDCIESFEQELGLLIGVMRRPPEQDDARTRMTTDGQQLPEVRVRRDDGSTGLPGSGHHVEIAGAERSRSPT